MYGVVEFMGEARGLDFFRKLAALKPGRRKGHVLVARRGDAGRAREERPHSHVALLFADLVLSPERLLADMGHNPPSRTQQTLLDRHKYVLIDPIKWLDAATLREKVWSELFLK